MKHVVAFAVVIIVFFAVETSTVNAYLTTDQHAFTFDGKTGIFLIDFEFGHENHDIYIPLIARAGTEASNTALGYQIYDDNDEAAEGTRAGIVLSNARLEDGMYVIPKGVAASFTLLVMYTIGEGETDTMFRNQVTHLPFTFDKTEQQKLNPSELQYYVTPLVALSNVTRVSVTGIDILVSGDSDPEDLNISAPNTTEVTVSN